MILIHDIDLKLWSAFPGGLPLRTNLRQDITNIKLFPILTISFFFAHTHIGVLRTKCAYNPQTFLKVVRTIEIPFGICADRPRTWNNTLQGFPQRAQLV